MCEIPITTEYITLGQFLKLADIISTGGEAKMFLSENVFDVNGELENRRGRKLRPGDIIKFKNNEVFVPEVLIAARAMFRS